jgi:FkbM family methyltransferase
VLRKNIGEASNVKVLQAAVGGSARQAYLDTSKSECRFELMNQAGGSAESVPVTTMEQLLEEFRIMGDIDLLKCDIEGSERELFSDCREWIGRVRNISIEVHGDYLKHTLLDDLRRNGADFEVARQNADENILLLKRRN